MKIGIFGTGKMAARTAETVRQVDGLELYAVASRTEERAETFTAQYGIPVRYGSYAALVKDPAVDLVYVATPHQEHYSNVMLALDNGKPVLCEKAFMLNAAEAERVIAAAREKKLYLAEALWTRYQPSLPLIRDFVFSGIIGDINVLNTEFINCVWDRRRIRDAAMGGGALMDLGVYCINFCRFFFGTDIVRTASSANVIGGVDAQESIQFFFRDGKMANATVSVTAGYGSRCAFFGTKGYIIVDDVHHPRSAVAYRRGGEILGSCALPGDVTGYEFQFLETERCLREGRTESYSVPLDETLAVMRTMDSLRKEWGVVFPGEN